MKDDRWLWVDLTGVWKLLGFSVHPRLKLPQHIATCHLSLGYSHHLNDWYIRTYVQVSTFFHWNQKFGFEYAGLIFAGSMALNASTANFFLMRFCLARLSLRLAICSSFCASSDNNSIAAMLSNSESYSSSLILTIGTVLNIWCYSLMVSLPPMAGKAAFRALA